MRLHVAATRYRIGEVLGGEEGRKMIEEERAWMVSEGVKRPEKMVRMIAPAVGS